MADQYVPLPDGSYAALPDEWSDAQVNDFLKKNQIAAKPAATSGQQPFNPPRMADAKGALKGAAHTAIDLGQLVHQIPGVSKAVDTLYGQPGLSEASFPSAREQTAYTNTAQRLGGAVETAAEMAAPVGHAADAVPTAAKAGAKFQEVMGAAKDLPVDTELAGQAALRVHQLSERGASMPMAVRKFLLRVTDPEKADMTYAEARDFASNLSRLSSQEYQRLTPVVGREVANLSATLNKAIGQTAAKAGKGQLYGVFDAVVAGAKKSAPWAGAVGVGTYLGKQLADILGPE